MSKLSLEIITKKNFIYSIKKNAMKKVKLVLICIIVKVGNNPSTTDNHPKWVGYFLVPSKSSEQGKSQANIK